MDPKTLRELLEAVQKGRVSPDQAADQLRTLPYEDLGFAKVDHHRALRRGFPEAVFGAGKSPAQIEAIVERIVARGQNALVTRAAPEAFSPLARRWPQARLHETARCLTVTVEPPAP